MATVAEKLLTAEEYGELPDNGQPTELVRGRIVPLNMPAPRHGEICVVTIYLLKRFLEDHPLGRVVSNDSGVITERDPDTVRGGDLAFYSYQRDVDARRKLIVGVNAFVEPDEKPIETLVIDEGVEKEQVAKLAGIKARRDGAAVRRCLDEVKRVAATKENLMPALLEAAEVRCTVGEIMAALADVFGRYDGAAKW